MLSIKNAWSEIVHHAPAYTGVIDYFFNTASPIVPEDGSQDGPDTVPPSIFDPQVSAISDTEISVSWSTDEPADAVVDYGVTPAYEQGSITDPQLTTNHEIIISDLTPGNTYEVRFTTTDAAGNSSQSDNFSVDISALPVIDVWYGDSLVFGQLGRPQWAANVLGNVFEENWANVRARV